MKSFILIFIVLTLIACNSNSDTATNSDDTSGEHTSTENMGGNHMKDMHDAMNNMMQQMQTMKPTGDPDYDFAMMMKHHHQGSIDMAKSELAGGRRSTIETTC